MLLPIPADLLAVSLCVLLEQGWWQVLHRYAEASPGVGGKQCNGERGETSARFRSRISQLDCGLYPWKQTQGTTRPELVSAF